MDPQSYELTVVDVVEETADARSISFAVPAGAEAEFAYRPGQFLTVAVPSDQTGVAARCYSLSSSPHDGGPLTVTVKRTVDGYASNWLCENLRAGDSLRVLPPSGIFTPASLDADLLLFAGGSGITPMMSIVRTALAHGGGHITLIYANRDERSVIFARELTRLASEHADRLQVIHWLESVQGLPTPQQIEAFAATRLEHDAFVCGPAPFMRLVTGALKELGFPRERRHQEKFVSLGGNPFGEVALAPSEPVVEPASSQADEAGEPVTLEVELDGRTHAFSDWAPGTTMLDHLEANGVKAPYSCREGECSACAVRLLSGEVRMLHNDVLDDDDLADGIRLACQSVPVGEDVQATYS